MQGKKKFTKHEAARIKALLREKANASRADQKNIRVKIRNIGFYITDFDQSFSGFTLRDFEDLIKQKMIIIVDG